MTGTALCEKARRNRLKALDRMVDRRKRLSMELDLMISQPHHPVLGLMPLGGENSAREEVVFLHA